ncbi:TonB-dependent receptor [Sphingomonas bacterium]|uniref:TonB-dependent receptor n=1 Tax=Sphingomonas bacterium TaxID=1895847 RepID=UPI001576C338|nr:TonB-dependent receptor [Sphingomonas bacterium]
MPNTAAANGPEAKNGDQIADIVVTAQKRVQNLQDVPVSIQVLDTRKLDQLQIRDFRDYVKYLPSVATSGSNPGSNATVVVRGIATDGGNYVQGSLPTVGIYLDEQPITTINGAADLHVYDLARVEVLSGPQGTLFGASSEAGTIRLITNRPDFTKLSGGYDLELNHYTVKGAIGGKAEGFINVPFNNSVALRVVGFYDHAGGYIRNLPSSRIYYTSQITVNNSRYAGANNNPVDTYGGRAQLAIKLSDDWMVTPSFVEQVRDRFGNFNSFPARGAGQLVTQRFGSDYSHDEFHQAGLTITGKVADLDLTYAGTYYDRHAHGDVDYADYAYFYDTMGSGFGAGFKDNAGRIIDPTQTFSPTTRSQKLSQEVRLATPTDWRIHGILGAFYQRQKEFFDYDYHINNLATSLSVTGHPGTYYLDIGNRIDRDYAVFSQADVDVTRQLTVTGGVRYYKYNNTLTDFNGTKGSEAGCIGPATIKGEPCTSLGVVRPDGSIGPVQVKDDGFTYRGNVTFKINRDHLLYATVSDGFRPGGANSRSTVNPGASITYGAEKLTNFELGSKNTFMNGRATANLTLFWEKWNGIQLAVETFSALTGTGGIYTTQNAGRARSRGAEFDFSVRPITGMTITSASTYTDARLLQDYFDGFSVVAPKGERLPFTSPFKSNIIGRYEFPFGSYRAHVQAAETYQSKAWNNFETSNRNFYGQRDAYATTDLAAGLEWNRMTFELYATNLLDARAITNKFNGCGVGTCRPDQYVIYNQPRLIGLRFGQRF